MDIDYGPTLRPRLDSHSLVDDASGHNVNSVEEPSRLRNPLGPDIYILPQRRISPLRSDIGLQNLLGRPTLIKTILNMTQTLLTTGK